MAIINMQQNAVADDHNNALFRGPQLAAVAQSNLPHIIDDGASVVRPLNRKREPGTVNGSARPALWPFVPLRYVTPQTSCHVFRGVNQSKRINIADCRHGWINRALCCDWPRAMICGSL